MKLKFIIPTLGMALLAVVLSSAPAKAETETACVRNGDGAMVVNAALEDFVTDTSGNVGDSCKEVPNFYKVTFYRFALCTQDPMDNGNSMDSCTFLVNSDAGVEHVIQGVGSPSVLDTSTADSPISPGSYSYIAMVLKNELGIKHTDTYSSNIIGRTGTGTTCWTVESKTAYAGVLTPSDDPTLSEPDPSNRSSLAMECGAAADAASAYTTEIFDSMGEGPSFAARLDDDEAILLQADNVTDATTALNAKRILVVLDNNAQVTPVSRFALKFTLTDAVSIDMARSGGVIYAIKNGADPFNLQLTITN